MELEELKNQWNLLSEQLKKNEIVNHAVIKRMIEKRTLSARDRLIGANVIAVFLLAGMLILFPLAATRVIIRQELLWIFYIVFPLLILYSFWNIHVCINSIWLLGPSLSFIAGFFLINAGSG